MNKKRIGIGIIIAGLLVLGIGIGLKFSNSEMSTNTYTIAGLVFNSVGLVVMLSVNKKC